MRNMHFKYIDDLSLAQSINLNDKLIERTNFTYPLNYHERTNHKIPSGNFKTKEKKDEIVKFARENEMVINSCKSKVMLFNKSTKNMTLCLR